MSGGRAALRAAQATAFRAYAVGGVSLLVSAAPSLLEGLDKVYEPFRSAPRPGGTADLTIEHDGAQFVLSDGTGWSQRRTGDKDALVSAHVRLGELIVERLARRGTYAIHAAALRDETGALIVTGRSGAGKTTLALALLERGMQLLSDEYALSVPDRRTIAPFLRNVQVRPGTPELVPAVGGLASRPLSHLAVDPKWPLGLDELERTFPGSLGGEAPLRHLVLLGPRRDGQAARIEPLAAGVAAVELTRATPAAADGFATVLAEHCRLVEHCRCARLEPGPLPETVERLLEWLGAADG